MARYILKCLECRKSYKHTYSTQICGMCGGLLEVVYAKITKPEKINSFWDMRGVLPDSDYKELELGTTKLASLSKGRYAKLEFENPTRSFKDRGSVVEVSKASDLGHSELACASTGNMAYSVSYYSKIYGLRARIFIGKYANQNKLRYIKETHNAIIERVDGDFSGAQKAAIEYSEKEGIFLAGDYCYRKEGQKTLSYEIARQISKIDDIIIPVGNATLFSGMYKGFVEMQNKNRRIPRLIGVEAEGCAPLVKAFESGNEARYEKPRTKADAIAVGLPTFWKQAIEGMKKSKGFAISVSDLEMEKARTELYMRKGIFVELGGAASMAATEKLGGMLGKSIVAILSGANF